MVIRVDLTNGPFQKIFSMRSFLKRTQFGAYKIVCLLFIGTSFVEKIVN